MHGGSRPHRPRGDARIEPDGPLPYWGYGDIPDQYLWHWDGDDGETPLGPDPEGSDLPPLRPGWGEPRRPTRRGVVH